MGRPPRADEANGIYPMLNRGNRRETIFHKPGDFEAFERILAKALDRLPIELFACCLLPIVSCRITGTWWSAPRSTGKWGVSASGWA